jgi:hypothetical protein
MELREIGPVSCAKVFALFYGAIGLIAGVIVAFVAAISTAVGGGVEQMSPLLGGVFGVGAILFLPVLYACFGAIGGLVFSALYNVIARAVGGIQVTLQ